LVKLSSGFRMTQAQANMLRHARGWMGSAEAKLRHTTTGRWFSDTQRPANHRHDEALSAAKGVSAWVAGGAPCGATGGGAKSDSMGIL